MTRKIKKAKKPGSRSTKRLSLPKTTLKDLNPGGTGPKGGVGPKGPIGGVTGAVCHTGW